MSQLAQNLWTSPRVLATYSQLEKLGVMCSKVDKSLWRDDMFRLYGKESRKELTKLEAMKFIDYLEKEYQV